MLSVLPLLLAQWLLNTLTENDNPGFQALLTGAFTEQHLQAVAVPLKSMRAVAQR